jgi:hypothetical protein
MTQKEAKELGLELWQYRVEHPEAISCSELPYWLRVKVQWLLNKCPLCEVFFTADHCPDCLLTGDGYYYCLTEGEPCFRWFNSPDEAVRKEAAEEVVHLIEAWKPKEVEL